MSGLIKVLPHKILVLTPHSSWSVLQYFSYSITEFIQFNSETVQLSH